MQRWKSAEGAAEGVAEKEKLPLKNYAHCDSFDTFTFNYIIVLHGADTLVFVLYNTVHLNNNNIIYQLWRLGQGHTRLHAVGGSQMPPAPPTCGRWK